MKHSIRFGLALSVVLAMTASAQTQRSGNDTARVMAQLQQLTAEKSQLSTENERLKKELEDLKAQLGKASSAQSAAEQRARKLEGNTRDSAALQESNDALSKARAQTQELVGKFRETAQQLKDVESDRSEVRSQLTLRERELKTCVDRNAQLYIVTDEILGRMESRGSWQSLKDKEPFTQLSRTRLENLIEDYRYRVDELRIGTQPTTAAR